MNTSREKIDELNAILKVNIEKNDYQDKVAEVLKDYRKKVQMPGFRAGKVPFSLVNKMYGKSVLAEEVNKLISQSIAKHITEEKLHVLGDPLPNEDKQKEIDWDVDENFEFIFDVAVAPEFEVKVTKRDKVPYYDIKVDEKFINETVQNHTRRFGTTDSANEVTENELLKGKLVQLDKDNNPIENGIVKEDAMISLEVMKDDKIKKSFVGKKLNDVITFNIKKALPSEVEIASLLGIDKEIAKDLNSNFNLTISEITKYIPSEINEDLFKKVFENDDIKTEEEFKNKISEQIKEGFIRESDYKLLLDIKDKYIEKLNFDLPENFLKRWLLHTNEELTQEQIDKDFDKFVEDLRWQLIKDKIIIDNEIKVEESEIVKYAKELTLAQFRQYGLMSIPDEQLAQYANEILGKKEEYKRISDKIFEDKVVAFIKENAKLDSKEVSTENI